MLNELVSFVALDVKGGVKVFFLGAFSLLGLILAAAIPSLLRGLSKQWRYLMARRSRVARMLADPTQLQRGARAVEGLYYFDGSVGAAQEVDN